MQEADFLNLLTGLMKGLFPTPPPDSSVLPCGQHKNVASPCAMLDHLVRRKSLQPGTAVGSW